MKYGKCDMKTMQRGSLKRVLFSVVAGTAALFAILGAAQIGVATHMVDTIDRVSTGSLAIHDSQLLETTISEQRRLRLIGNLTGDRRSVQTGKEQLVEAGRIVERLISYANTPEERVLAARVKLGFQRFRNAQLALPSAPEEVLNSVPSDEPLLQTIKQLRNVTEAEMEFEQKSATTLNVTVVALASMMVILATVGLTWIGYGLWSRISQPLSEVTNTANEIQQGDFQARASISGSDEMWAMVGTFNDMVQMVHEREQDRLLYVATVAHDLKSPLATIGIASQLLQKRSLEGDEQNRWSNYILRGVQGMEGMLADLTENLQWQTGTVPIHLERVDLPSLTSTIVNDKRMEVRDHQFSYCTENEHCFVDGDRKQLTRVLVNLLSNAVQYSPSGSEVQVEVHCLGDSVSVKVEDHGPGVAPEDINRLFQPFVRLDRTCRYTKSNGLGLVSVKKIVEAHQGTVTFNSEVGVGTAVEVWLPRQRQTVALS